MPAFQTSRRVAHTAANMFALVADVERYPEFVPLCQNMVVKSRESGAGERETVVTATMTVAYKMLRESFTSRITLMPASNQILVHYLDGPFKQLENRWTFTPEGETSQVGFFLTYEFRSRMFQALMGAVFDRAFRKFADAFERRADAVYGHKAKVAAPV